MFESLCFEAPPPRSTAQPNLRPIVHEGGHGGVGSNLWSPTIQGGGLGSKGGVSWHTSRARSRGPWMAIPSPRPAPGWRLRRRSPGVVWQCGGSERRRFALKSRSATKLDLAGTYRLTAGPAAGEAKFWMHRAGARPAAIQGGGKGLRPEIQDPRGGSWRGVLDISQVQGP